jgi:hypothetical protein
MPELMDDLASVEAETEVDKTEHSWFRGGLAVGLAAGVKVDHESGVIPGVAIVTEGPAKGHGVHLDREFVETVVEFGNKRKLGLKSRFGHPNMSSTAFGTFLGRYRNFRCEDVVVEGKKVAVGRADLTLSETSHATPNGDLGKYVLEMAENEPDMFGTSIVFSPGKTYVREPKEGKKVYDYYEYDRRDGERYTKKEYVGLPVFVECKALHANDVVDEPAANPQGLFSAWSSELVAGQVTEFLDEHPEVWDLLKKEQVAKAFFARYEEYRERATGAACSAGAPPREEEEQQSQIKENFMANDAGNEAAASAAVKPAAETAPAVNFQEQAAKFQAKFGAKAIDYLAKGLTFEQALSEHVELQAAELAKAKAAPKEVAAAAQGAESLAAADTKPAAPEQKQLTNASGLEKAKELLAAGKFSDLKSALFAVYRDNPELKPVPRSNRG